MSKSKGDRGESVKVLYRETLSAVCRARYLEKLSLIDGIDPYEMRKTDWSKDAAKWPEITYPDIVNYPVNSTSAYTLGQLKAYKSLQAYNYFVSGWVLDLGHSFIKDKCVISGRVKHSQRMNDTSLKPWVIAEPDGNVIAGHCDCMAGLGEVCSHVGALLFAVEAAVKIRNSTTVTQETCYWLPSAVQKVQYRTIQEIDFTSAATKKRKLDQVLGNQVPSLKAKKLPQVCETTPEDFLKFCGSLDRDNAKSSLLSLVPGFAVKFRPKALDTKYPQVLSELYNEECSDLSHEALMDHCDAIYHTLCVSKEESENCEEDTRQQAGSKRWFSFRAGRITASKVKSACRTSLVNPSKSLIKDICYPSSRKFTSRATSYGCDHEREARHHYMSLMLGAHENFKIRESGLVINPDFPFMGATPDGVGSCDCCGEVLLEIKCPFCARESEITDAVDCLETVDGKLSLKRQHAYFYQVQCQLLLCDKEYCDFVVWTSKDFFSERITIDFDFCQEMVDKSRALFKTAVLPELVGKIFSNPRQVTA